MAHSLKALRYRVASALQPESAITVVGTSTAPITDPATARPADAVAVYWLCANGVTPTNAAAGDLIWNAT